MKTYYLVSALLLTICANAQVLEFEPIQLSKESIFSKENDQLSIKTLEMLGKTSDSNLSLSSVLPSDYNWTTDLRRSEAIQRVASGVRRQDNNGRDLIPDINDYNMQQLGRYVLQTTLKSSKCGK